MLAQMNDKRVYIWRCPTCGRVLSGEDEGLIADMAKVHSCEEEGQ
jgi:hypothetical protein